MAYKEVIKLFIKEKGISYREIDRRLGKGNSLRDLNNESELSFSKVNSLLEAVDKDLIDLQEMIAKLEEDLEVL